MVVVVVVSLPPKRVTHHHATKYSEVKFPSLSVVHCSPGCRDVQLLVNHGIYRYFALLPHYS